MIEKSYKKKRRTKALTIMGVSLSALFFIFIFYFLFFNNQSNIILDNDNQESLSFKSIDIVNDKGWDINYISYENGITSSITPLNNKTLEITVDNSNGGGYKFSSAICSSNPNMVITKEEYNPNTQIWTNTGQLNYDKLTNYGMPSSWCNNGNGYILFGSGSKDLHYKLNFEEGNRDITLLTGKGTEEVSIVYQDISRVSYIYNDLEMNITLFIFDNGVWDNTNEGLFVYDNNGVSKFGANVTGYNQDMQFKYIIEGSNEIKEIAPNIYSIIKDNKRHDVNFADICDIKVYSDDETIEDNFNPECSFDLNNNKLEITFNGEYRNGLISIDPTIILSSQSSYSSTNNGVTNRNGFAYLDVDTTGLYNGLQIYLPFDDNTSSTLVYDYSKYKRNISKVNSPTVANSIYGKDIDLELDSTQYLNAGDINSLDGITGITIAFWIKLESGNADRSILGKGSNPNDILVWYDYGDGCFGQSYTYYLNIGNAADCNNRLSIGNSGASTGVWQFVTYTKSGTSMKAYLNGVNTANRTASLSGIPDAGTSPLYIGKSDIIATGFDGQLDEVMIFNTTLTAAQILSIYQNTSSRFTNSGTQKFTNVNVSGDGTENKLNITLTSYQNLYGSNISVSLDEGSTYYNLTSSGIINNVSFSQNPNALNITFKYWAGDNNFYMPIMIGNLTLESYSSGVIPPTDDEYPSFSNYTDNNATLTDSGLGIFSVNVAKTNGTVILHIDGSDIVATNTSDWFNASYNFASGGTYLYNWTAYGNGTSTNLNTSALRYYTVNTTVPDTEYPVFSNYLTNPSNNTQYFVGMTNQFNTTITKTNGSAGIEFNNVNYSLTNLSTSFYKTFSGLSAGTYPYYYWAYGNGSSNLYNNSQVRYYTIAKNSTLTLGISGTSPIEYETTTDVAGSDCPSQLSCSLDKTNKVYGVGTETFNYSTSGNANYTSSSTTIGITINQNTSYVLGISGTTPISYGTATNVAGSGCPSQISCSLDKSNGVYGVGTETFNYSTSGNNNYTMDSITKDIVINQISSEVAVYLNGTRGNMNINNAVGNYLINLTAYLLTGQGNINLYVNDTLFNSGSSPLINISNFSVGIYTIKVNNTDTQNYSADSESHTLTISAEPPPTPTTTSASACRYKKFGYFNPNLPILKEANCI